MDIGIGELITGAMVVAGGMWKAKHWLGKMVESLGRSYVTLIKAEQADSDQGEDVSPAEYEQFGRDAMPLFIELRKRLRGLTLFKWRF